MDNIGVEYESYPLIMLAVMESPAMLVASFKKYGVSGYTILRARGEGSSGVQADISGFDANIMVKVILPEQRMQPLLESLTRKINKGYHLTVFISDVQVITPEKFDKPLTS